MHNNSLPAVLKETYLEHYSGVSERQERVLGSAVTSLFPNYHIVSNVKKNGGILYPIHITTSPVIWGSYYL